MAMYGFSNENIQTLITVDKSWNYAPEISDVEGVKSLGYIREEKAYLLHAEKNEFSFKIESDKASPLHNPCFVIGNWNSKKKAEFSIDGVKLKDGKSLRQGIVINEDGKEKLLIWLKLSTDSSVRFSISGAKPEI